MYYNTCARCGAHLDPDEYCNCFACVRGKKFCIKIGHAWKSEIELSSSYYYRTAFHVYAALVRHCMN